MDIFSETKRSIELLENNDNPKIREEAETSTMKIARLMAKAGKMINKMKIPPKSIRQLLTSKS